MKKEKKNTNKKNIQYSFVFIKSKQNARKQTFYYTCTSISIQFNIHGLLNMNMRYYVCMKY